MSSPFPPHSINVELFVNGAWTSIPGDVFQRQPMRITRGYSGETSRAVDPGMLTALLDNRSKNYSPRNPASTYYGVLKKNTPVRVSVSSGGTNYRFWGELAGLTPSADISGKDLTASLQAGGILRRLRQGASPAPSALRTYIPTLSPLAYWPLDDGPLSSSGAPLAGTYSFLPLRPFPQNWGQGALSSWLPNGLQGVMGPAPGIDGANFAGFVTPQAASTGWNLDWVVNGRTDYFAQVGHNALIGDSDSWAVSMSPSVNNILVTPPVGSTGGGSTAYIHDGLFHHIRFAVIENFIGDANYFVYIDGVLVTTGHVTAAGPEPVLSATYVQFDLNDGLTGSANTTRVSIGHVAFWENVTPPPITTMVNVAYGRPGELAGDRITRLCAENSIPLTFIGSTSTTKSCGPQYALPVTDLLDESALVDGGFLSETIGAVGLTYQSIDATYNRTADLALNYATNHHLGAPLAPVDDDQALRNDVTVTRKSAGSFEVRQTVGPLQITAPPTGVGKYTDSATINCLFDYQAQDQAGWRALNLGTVDAARFPSLILNMDVLPLTQRAQVMALNVGARITIDNPPSWLAPDQIDLLLVGIKESLNTLGTGSTPAWQIELVCQPFAPYRVAVADSATLGRAAPNDNAATVTCTSGATSWSVATSSGPLWTTVAADFPFDVNVEGERVTVTNITGASSPQTFTVTRSVNGVSKAHTAAVVSLWQPSIAAL